MPTLLWKLIEEIRPDDRVAIQRTPPMEFGPADWHDTLEALLLGAFISEGFVSEKRAGFNNLDRDYFNMVVAAYDAVVGGPALRFGARRSRRARGFSSSISRTWQRSKQPPRPILSASVGGQGRTGMAVARAGRSEAGVPAGAVRGRRFVLRIAAQHHSGLLLDAQ